MSKQEKQDRALAAEWVEVAKAAKRLHAAARAAAASVPATDGNMLAHSQAHSLVTRLGKLTTAAAAMDLQLIRKTLARVEPRVREAAFANETFQIATKHAPTETTIILGCLDDLVVGAQCDCELH